MGTPSSEETQICDQCERSLTPLTVPHVKRRCDECYKTVHVAEPGEGGRGIMVRKGDQFVMPPGSISMSLDPSKATGRFFRPGVSWFVKMLYFEGMTNDAEELDSVLQQYEEQADRVLERSSLLADYDLEDPDDVGKAFELVKDRDNLSEWWAFMLGSLASLVGDYVEAGDSKKAAHTMGALVNARSMLIFLENLEETVWQGYALGNLRRVLDIWEGNKRNSNEEFWQSTLSSNIVVLSQVFSFPAILLQDKAYVGGTGLDQSGGNLVDHLLANNLTENTALVEIKTPETKLLGRKYRGTYSPSSELAGAVAQITNYRHSLVTNAAQPEINVYAFDPPCLVIAGNLGQLSNSSQQKSFELYRQNVRNVQIITYDELFSKIENLVNLLQNRASAR